MQNKGTGKGARRTTKPTPKRYNARKNERRNEGCDERYIGRAPKGANGTMEGDMKHTWCTVTRKSMISMKGAMRGTHKWKEQNLYQVEDNARDNQVQIERYNHKCIGKQNDTTRTCKYTERCEKREATKRATITGDHS